MITDKEFAKIMTAAKIPKYMRDTVEGREALRRLFWAGRNHAIDEIMAETKRDIASW